MDNNNNLQEWSVLYGPPPVDNSYQEPQPRLYGPPPIANSYEVLYGPPPIQNMNSMPTLYGPPPPHKRGCSCFIISLVVGAILGGVIAWLLGDCSHIQQPTVYGPPPVDTIASPMDILNGDS